LISTRLSAQQAIVIELFTSQGCSSCPDADANLSKILDDAEKAGTPILGLSFHVDYWNHLGWKDPYSSKVFTDRQKMYASIMNLNSIYTPQMIINGNSEFVGSDLFNIKKNITAVPGNHSMLNIRLSNPVRSGDELTVNYMIDKNPKGDFLNIAVVDRAVENFVPKGENSGKNLRHGNVVRIFSTIEAKKSGQLTVKIPRDLSDGSSLIVFVQDEQLAVLAATSYPLK
jgi:hypothetical protein